MAHSRQAPAAALLAMAATLAIATTSVGACGAFDGNSDAPAAPPIYGTSNSGFVSTDIGQLTNLPARQLVKRLPDGRTIVGGAVAMTLANHAVACFLASGTGLDTSWGKQGLIQPVGYGFIKTMIVETTGRVLLGVSGETSQPTLERYDANGQSDPSFGQFARRTYSFDAAATGALADVTTQADGRYVVAASAGTGRDYKALVFRVWN